MIQTLPRVMPEPPGKALPDGGSELRLLAHAVALDPSAWTPDLAALVTGLLDHMAVLWDAEHATGRLNFLTDALARGGPMPSGICLEIGSGTGQHTPFVAGAFDHVIAVDLAREMLTLSTAHPAARLQADAARLPLARASIAAAVCIDVLLLPAEIARVPRGDGMLI